MNNKNVFPKIYNIRATMQGTTIFLTENERGERRASGQGFLMYKSDSETWHPTVTFNIPVVVLSVYDKMPSCVTTTHFKSRVWTNQGIIHDLTPTEQTFLPPCYSGSTAAAFTCRFEDGTFVHIHDITMTTASWGTFSAGIRHLTNRTLAASPNLI